MINNEIKTLENNDIYVREKLEYICQFKLRSRILEVLKREFDVEELIVIKEKIEEERK